MFGIGIIFDICIVDQVGVFVMKKVIWWFGFFFGLFYFVVYIDWNNVGFVKLEMMVVLQIMEVVFGFVVGIFFIGYLLFEVLSNLLLERFGVCKWIVWIMIFWGIVVVFIVFVQDVMQFVIVCFVFGIVEVGFFFGVLFYFMFWFLWQYCIQVFVVFVFLNLIVNVVVVLLLGWMFELYGLWGFDGWQFVFLLQGVLVVFFVFVVFFWFFDCLQDVCWFDCVEQCWISDILVVEIVVIEQKYGCLWLCEVFSNGCLWMFIVFFFGVVFGVYGLGMWLLMIVKSMGDFFNLIMGWFVVLLNLCVVFVMLLWECVVWKQGNILLQIGIMFIIIVLLLMVVVVVQDILILVLIVLCIGMLVLFFMIFLFWSFLFMVFMGIVVVVGLVFINLVGNFVGFVGFYVIGWISQIMGLVIWGLFLIVVFIFFGVIIVFVLSWCVDFMVFVEVWLFVDVVFMV